MERLKKVFSAGVLAALVFYVTEWTNLLHSESLVHPDWDKTVDGDAKIWSVAALIILYILIQSLTRRFLTPIVIILVLIWCGLMWLCSHFAYILPGIPVVETANQYIGYWRLVFIAADVCAVCAGAAFGLWLVAKDATE
jgi:hypothetical protein